MSSPTPAPAWRRRVIALACAAVGAVALVTVLDSGDDTPPGPTAAERSYAAVAGKLDPEHLAGVESTELAKSGHDVCGWLQAGQSVPEVLAHLQLAFSGVEARALVGAAPALCPGERQRVLDGLAGR